MFPTIAKPVFGTFIQYQAEALVEAGHQVTVINPIPWVPLFLFRRGRQRNYRKIPGYRFENGVHIYHPRFLSIPRHWLFQFRGYLMYLGARRLMARLVERHGFDIIHCHVPLPDGEVGMHLAKRFGIPFGVTVHGSGISRYMDINATCGRRIRKVLLSADFVAFVSDKLYELAQLKRIKLSANRTRVIHNGIKVHKLADGSAGKFVDPKCINLLSVAHMKKHKGIGNVLIALAEIRKQFPLVRYHLVGDGVDLPYFRQVARDKGVDDLVIFHGAQSNADCQRFMQVCEVFVLPSVKEGFGVVYIEAMFHGMITMGSKREGIDGIIRDGENGFLVEAGNPAEIATKLTGILMRLDSLTSIREAAKRTVWPAFSWERNVEQYLALYRQVV